MADQVQAAHGTSLPELLLEAGINFVTGVPDSDLGSFVTALEQAAATVNYVLATREDNAIALAVGAYLAGRTPLVFMKNAGLGNSIDALTSLVMIYDIPLVLLISWSGYQGQDVPHHNVIGEPLRPLIESLGLPIFEADLGGSNEHLAEVLRVATEHARSIQRPVAVLGVPKGLWKGASDAA